MNERKVTASFLFFLACLLIFAGCDNKAEERDKAMVEAEKAKAELASAETALEKLQNERDELRGDLAVISENLEKGDSELITLNQTLQEQVNRLTSERDLAVGRAEDARSEAGRFSEQLKEEVKDNQEYQGWVKELQATIEGLEAQIKELSELPVEQIQDEMVEYEDVADEVVEDEEVADGNNV